MASSAQDIRELNLGHSIFISHSGKNKTFARLLFKELRNRWYHPFLDEWSLPKGTEINMHNILIEARSCKLALLVLTPAFFTITRNPMLEVMAFVDSGVRMLPLFYQLTVEEVKNNIDHYREKWIKLDAKPNDPSPQCTNIETWNRAYKKITEYNGVEYGKKSTNEADFIEEVANFVHEMMPSHQRRDDRHIVGKERLVKAVEDMFEDLPKSGNGIKILGLHGMEGTGKTTLCQALCNFYLSEFKDRVCHVQLHEGSSCSRIDSILLQLGSRNNGSGERTHAETEKQLERTLSASKFFLVIDDIQEFQVDKDEVRSLILSRLTHIPSGSKLLFLARCPSSLRNVFFPNPEVNESNIHQFPSLSLDEAQRILCREIPSLLPEEGLNDQQQISFLKQCTKLCTSRSGSNEYNPLMLKLLASFLGEEWVSVSKGSGQGRPNFERFKKRLSSLQGDRSPGMKDFFKKLETRFNTLGKEDQDLFLDLALFAPREVSKQVCLRRDKKDVKAILEKLQHAAFLSDDYGIFDVYKELAKMIARKSPERFYLEGRNLKGPDLRHLVKKTWTRVAFVGCKFQKKVDLDLSGCTKIQILLLDRNEKLSSVITPSDTLQSMEIRSETRMLVKNRFSEFKLLAILELGGAETSRAETSRWSLDTATLSQCEALEIVHLYDINLEMNTWELPCWPYLKELRLSRVCNLQVLRGLEHLSILKKLHLSQLGALTSLSDVQSLGKLTTFVLDECDKVSELRLPGSLQHCTIEKCVELSKIDFGDNAVDRMDTSEDTEAESSDDEWVASGNEIKIKDCRNLQEISGLQEEGQPFGYRGDFRRVILGESERILYIESHESAQSWYLHVRALGEERGFRFVDERSGNGNELKSLKVVCGCGEESPSFYRFRGLECLVYHSSDVTDFSPIHQCVKLRILSRWMHQCGRILQLV